MDETKTTAPPFFWVRLDSGPVDKVKTDRRVDIADFAVAIKEKFPNILEKVDAGQLEIFLNETVCEPLRRSSLISAIASNNEDDPLFVRFPLPPPSNSVVGPTAEEGRQMTVLLNTQEFNRLLSFVQTPPRTPSGAAIVSPVNPSATTSQQLVRTTSPSTDDASILLPQSPPPSAVQIPPAVRFSRIGDKVVNFLFRKPNDHAKDD